MLDFFLSLIFPKQCVYCKKIGSYLCDACFSGIEINQQYVCPMCLRHSITGETHPSCIKPYGLDGLASGVVYRGAVKRLIYAFKFQPYVANLKKTVSELFIESISQNELFMRVLSSQPIVAEVPLSSQKLKNRGYNQAEILAQSLINEFKLQKMPKLLIRIKNTKPQFTLDKEKREQNIHGAFDINVQYKNKIKHKTVILVDDLATSCVTLKECAKVLKRCGASRVYGVTFAREV